MQDRDGLFRGLISIKGVARRDGRIALVRNRRDEWDLPGGKLEENESFLECLRREFEEELGVEVDWQSPERTLAFRQQSS